MSKPTQPINMHHHNMLHYSTLTIKSVVKSNEMENDMFRKIEKWVLDCYDDPKMKIKDDI